MVAIAPGPVNALLDAAVCPLDPVTKDAEGPAAVADGAPSADGGAAETDDTVDDSTEVDAADDADEEDDVWNKLAQVLLGWGGAAPGGIVLMLDEAADDAVAGLGTTTTSWCCCFVESAAPAELAGAVADAVTGTARCGIASTFFDSICGGMGKVCPLPALLPPLTTVPPVAVEDGAAAALTGRWLWSANGFCCCVCLLEDNEVVLIDEGGIATVPTSVMNGTGDVFLF